MARLCWLLGLALMAGSKPLEAQSHSCAAYGRGSARSAVFERSTSAGDRQAKINSILRCDVEPAAALLTLWQDVPSDTSVLADLLYYTNGKGSPLLARGLLSVASDSKKSDLVRLTALAALASQFQGSSAYRSAAHFARSMNDGGGYNVSMHHRDVSKDIPLSSRDLTEIRTALEEMAKGDPGLDRRRAASWFLEQSPFLRNR